MDSPIVDVLIPTAQSPVGLGATLAALAGQRYPAFRVAICLAPPAAAERSSIASLVAILEARGHPVVIEEREGPDGPLRAMAMLEASAPLLLVVEDGVFLEPDLIGRLVAAIRSARCGFVGASVVDLRQRPEVAPEGAGRIAFWDGPVRPEDLNGAARAERRRLHHGANLQRLRERLPRTRDRLYRVGDIVGCVLYDTERLRSVGGFPRPALVLPAVPGPACEPPSDPGQALAQERLISRHGGAGLFPSGAFRVIAVPQAAPSATPTGSPVPRILRARPPRRAIPRNGRRVVARIGRHGVASRARRTLALR
ncbi:MAG: glycosyltransferase [Candidatus Limnocylindrales bacterium]